MSRGGKFNVGRIVTARAIIVCVPTDLGASGGLRLSMENIVIVGIDRKDKIRRRHFPLLFIKEFPTCLNGFAVLEHLFAPVSTASIAVGLLHLGVAILQLLVLVAVFQPQLFERWRQLVGVFALMAVQVQVGDSVVVALILGTFFRFWLGFIRLQLGIVRL